MQPFIAVSGIIGAGKSTFTEHLGVTLGLPVYREPVETNPFLGMFYEDMKKWSFPMQVFLLNERFRQHQELVWRQEGGVQDRSIYEDTIFAEMLYEDGLMSRLEYKTYLDLFLNMTKFLQRPDVMIHLDVSPELAHQRINSRGRSVESTIPLDYLRSLHAGYDKFVSRMSGVLNIKVVDWTEFRDPEVIAKELGLMEVPSNRFGNHL